MPGEVTQICASCEQPTDVTIRNVCPSCFIDPARRPLNRCKSCMASIPEGWRWCNNTCRRDDEGYDVDEDYDYDYEDA